MSIHERNPICIKDSEHLAELIKVRFDASDARQEEYSKNNDSKLEEIKKQVVYTNGRTRKLEDYHIEQMAFNRDQLAVNRELLEFVKTQKDYNIVVEGATFPIIWLKKNGWAIITVIISLLAIYITIKSNSNDINTKCKQPDSGQHRKIDRDINGSASLFGDNHRAYTVFRVY